MRIKLNYIAPLLAGGAAAVAIAAAPSAAAADPQSCSGTGSGTICQSPGNVQLNDSPPPVQFSLSRIDFGDCCDLEHFQSPNRGLLRK